jgi:hypothetical protein
MVFGPAGVFCMGSQKNCPGHAPRFADVSRADHRTVTSQKSDDFIDAAGAFGQGARKANVHSLMRMRSVGVPALAPDGEPSAETRPVTMPASGEVAALWVVPDGDASLQENHRQFIAVEDAS